MTESKTPRSTTKLSHLSSAYRVRDAMQRIAEDTVSKKVSRVRYATVTAIDTKNRIITCQYPGETNTFPVKAGTLLPLSVGATVRLGGENGARYVLDIISGGVSVNGITLLTNTTWTAPTLSAGWVNVGAPYQVVQYRLEGDLVRLRGSMLKPSAVATLEVLFNLPVGFRPPANLIQTTWSIDLSASPTGQARPIIVTSTGDVQSQFPLGGISNRIDFDCCFSTTA